MNDLTPVTQVPLTPGQQLRFDGDRNPWLVRAASENFALCARRFAGALGGTGGWPEIMYTVLDWRAGVRGIADGRSDEAPRSEAECAAMLAEFEAGDLEVSRNHHARIEITEVWW